MPTSISMSEAVDIQWGTVKSYTKAKTFYSSFISEGVTYELFDNVEVYNGGGGDDDSEPHADPYIGKIVKLWEEKENGICKVLIRWFFRLKDLDKDMEGDPRELYLAFGIGKGVTNENDLEVICGKCKVLCTSKDTRNRQPSARDLKNADYFFSKIYNVDLQHVSPVHRVVDKLGCEAVYNKPEWVTGIPKNKNNPVEQLNPMEECKRGSTLKRKAQCMGDSLSDVKDKHRGTGVINDTQQKICQGSDLTVQQSSSMNKVMENKKLKTLATASPLKKVATANRLQQSEFTPSVGEVVASKILTSGDSAGPSSKVNQEEIGKTDELVCAPAQTNLNTSNLGSPLPFVKTSASETASLKADDALGQQTARQLDENGRAENILVKETCIDTPKIKEGITEGQTSSFAQNKSASNLLKEVKETCIDTQKIKEGITEGQASSFTLPKSASNLLKEEKEACIVKEGITEGQASSFTLPKSASNLLKEVKEACIDNQRIKESITEGQASSSTQPKSAFNLLKEVKETCIDTQMIKEGITEIQTSSFTQPKSASILLKEEKEKNSYGRIEMNRSASNSRVKGEFEGAVQADPKVGVSLERKGQQAKRDSSSLPEPGNALKATVVKVSRPDGYNKKPPVSTGSVLEKKSDSEKKLTTTTEPVRVAENWKIFKELPWEQNLQQGILSGRVLLLQNLDPCLTSADVRDMMKNILQGVSDVRMIPQETLCPYAPALAIFESKLLAESALQEMERKCLVVANNRRPIIACKFKEPTNFTRFPGHLALEKLKLSRNLGADEYKKAVSTSHCSQPNTIEYEMAMEWRRLQEIIQTCRAELFERQRKEMEEIRKSCGSEDH